MPVVNNKGLLLLVVMVWITSLMVLPAQPLATSAHSAQFTRDYSQAELRMESGVAPPATLRVVAYPWGTTLNDTELSFATGPDIEQSDFNGSTLSLVAYQYPVLVNVSLFAGETYATVQIAQASSRVSLEVNASKLSVSTLVNGVGTGGASITVVVNGGGVVASALDRNQPADFYLPLGNYTVTATLRSTTQTDNVLSQTGKSSAVVFDLLAPNGQQSQYDLTYWLLLATGIIGVVASAGVWAEVYRKKTHDA